MRSTSGFYAAVLLFAIAGCASTDSSLQLATANFLGSGHDPDRIVISNIDRGMTTVKWDAIEKSDSYKCNADDMVRRVICVKK